MNRYFYLIIRKAKLGASVRARTGRVVSFAALAGAMLTTVGCGDAGPPRAAVQGDVSWKGAPVEDGMISFVPQTAGPAVTAKIVGGKYALPQEEGAILATHTVQIFGIKHLGSVEAGPPLPPGTKIESTEQFIPAKFNNSSKITVDIKEGENQHDFKLPM